MKERLRRLYQNGKDGLSPSITIDGVLTAISKGMITLEEAVEITGEENSADIIKAAKIKEISKVCNEIIVSGIDVQIGNRVDHFNLSLEDQSNINNLFRVVELGGTEYPYQADDGTCTIYSADEISKIYLTAQSLITTQLTYHNALKAYLQSLTKAEDIVTVSYGMDLPEPFAAELKQKLTVANTQMEAIITRLGS